MVWQCVRRTLLASALLAAAAVPARADDCAAPAPCTRTVCVRECVPETYTATRTVYREVVTEQKYTAYRCESVPEVKTRVVTHYERVPEVQNVVRNVCTYVQAVEQRTVMQTHVTCKPVTHMTRRCVDRGHWECREVPCAPSWKQRMKKLCKKDCCEPCCPPPTKIEKVWVPCKVWEEVPVTTMQRVCESHPVVIQVNVCKPVVKQETVQVTSWKCVPVQKTETFQVLTQRQIPYEATRKVVSCVPHQETVTLTRNVWKTVYKEVPAAECCATTTTCCSAPAKHARKHGCCH